MTLSARLSISLDFSLSDVTESEGSSVASSLSELVEEDDDLKTIEQLAEFLHNIRKLAAKEKNTGAIHLANKYELTNT